MFSTGQLTENELWEHQWVEEERRLPVTLRPQRRYFHYRWDRFVKRMLRPAKDGERVKLLEVGCGTGKFLIYFHHPFFANKSGI